MPVLSIAGAGTDIGKTYVAAALLRALARRGLAIDALKPVASGVDEADYTGSDPAMLLEALGQPVTAETVAHIAPLRFAAPLSPPLAAKREGRVLAFSDVRDLCQTRTTEVGDAILLVETAGGVMSPLDDDHTMLDLMAALSGPVVLVSGSYLGAISHTLTALACLRARGLQVAAVAVSESSGEAPFDETVAALARLAGDVPLVAFRRDASPESSADDLAARLAALF
ncbi:ATP-dependent dethiobiotin synthetase BioD [Alphaproteobacteria bacterium SO-S41]|nr:ATP-dependent dethiobiotin synthetase BioD [Alphaproteobacteria bacterium SO-S41]